MTLLTKLEAERLDISYRVPADKRQTIFVDEAESLFSVYYHAGRYAAGARDKQAINADKEFQSLLSNR